MRVFVCCDGTWNDKDNPDDETGRSCPTNVRRFFDVLEKGSTKALPRKIEIAEEYKSQIAYYSAGVGTGMFDRVWGGLSGLGMGRRIRDAYQFLMQVIKDESDEIFLIGFSRGAFTARSVAGMIQHSGLLKSSGSGDAQRVKAAYKSYRHRKARKLPDELEQVTRRGVKIHFVGVWDTVGGLGLPIWGRSFHILGRRQPHDIQANQVVLRAFHAVGMDEQRAAYVPALWESDDNGEGPQILEQIWFRGVHSDIGGGYPERGLANVTFEWLVNKAKEAGAKFDENQLQNQLKSSEPTLHDSLGSMTWLAGVWPRGVPVTGDTSANSEFGRLDESVSNQKNDLENDSGGGKRIQHLRKGENVTVKIHSRYLWNTTGIVLEKDAEYLLEPHGVWIDQTRKLGPEGETRSGVLWYLPGKWLRIRRARWFELIGLISGPRHLRSKSESIWRALWYLIVQDPLEFRKGQFQIGKGRRLVPKETGILSCYANDHWWFYWNNKGSVDLKVTRLN